MSTAQEEPEVLYWDYYYYYYLGLQMLDSCSNLIRIANF